MRVLVAKLSEVEISLFWHWLGDTVRKIKLLLRQKGDAFDSSVKSFLNTESLSAIPILRPDWNKF